MAESRAGRREPPDILRPSRQIPGTLPAEPHRRYNPLTDEWVLVSSERNSRPWQGHRDERSSASLAAYDASCYLCPGNIRANGDRNPDYADTFVFTNDFAALRPDTPLDRFEDGLLLAEGEAGTCRVLCFSPRHDLTLGRMAPPAVRRVVDVWAEQTEELGTRYRWVQVFENRGATMGASNPHPHGQIWAGTALPGVPRREGLMQARHWGATGRRLLVDYAEQEAGGQRVIAGNDEWLAVVPFWAVWPFETLLMPRRPAARLTDLDDARRDALSLALIELLTRYDGLFNVSFPYSMGWHQAPFDGDPHPHWQLHAHFCPPLLRSATVRKFMVGYELLSEAQRDLSPEEAAERLRSVLVGDSRAAEAAADSPRAAPVRG